MNTTQLADGPPNLDRFAEALRLNTAALVSDVSATTDALQQTVQLQQEAQISLLDRLALLEAQLKEAQQETARAKTDLEASRVASAAMARQVTSHQEELAQLRQRDEQLRKLVMTFAELDRIPPESWHEWNNNDYAQCAFSQIDIQFILGAQRQMKENNFARNGTYIPTPAHWEPIVAQIKKARDLIASQPNLLAK